MVNKNKTKVLVIQPHSDDAILSCSKILFDAENYKSVDILTIENNPIRVLEDRKLFDFFPAVNYNVLDFDYIDSSHSSYFKSVKKFDELSADEHIYDLIGDDGILDLVSKTDDFISDWIRKTEQEGFSFEIYTPLGVGHPFHLLVRKITEGFATKYYREWPHSFKRRNQDYLMSVFQPRLDGLRFEKDSEHFNIGEHEMKFKLAQKCYKTQSGLFFYELGYIKKNLPEEFYSLV